MKITCVQALLAVLFMSASWATDVTAQELLDRRLSLTVRNENIKAVLRDIEKMADVKFSYSPQIVPAKRLVSFSMQNTTLREVLENLLSPLRVSYNVSGQQIILTRVPNDPSVGLTLPTPTEQPQTVLEPERVDRAVTGVVTDEKGEGLPGVSVLLKGTQTGSVTDINGRYSVNVPNSGGTLIFSFIGYVSQEVLIGNRSAIDIKLVTDIKSLNEVVVVGYGTQRKSDITGSVASVSSEALREVPVANLQQALQGRAAGLEIQQIGTKPGAGAQIRIRGERSINGSNDPLIVLDGIPFEGGNLNDINPNEVESVEVLKDASATAIYGSRGANGIILVTTKRGKAGPAKLTVNSYYGVSTVVRRYPVYNADQYRALRDISVFNGGYMLEELESIKTGRTTDWQDLMYKNGFISDNSLGLSGGTQDTQFSLAGGYFKQTTVLPGQDFTRYSLRATIDSRIGKRFKLGLNTLNTLGITNGDQFVNPMFNILSLSPLMPAYDANGGIVKAPAGNVDDQANTYSPLLLFNNNNNWVDRKRRLRTFNSLYAEFQIIDGLKYRLNLGLDYRQEQQAQFQGADSYFRVKMGNTASVNNIEGFGYTIENLLTYDKTIAKKHRISLTGLYSRQVDRTYNSYAKVDSIDQDFIQFYNLGQAKQSATNRPTLSGSESTWGLISYMLRVNYAYNDKYLLTITGRRDGSSRLANKWHNYPAVSLGWNIANEAFMNPIKVITNLKLRAGWGETSNQAVAPYSSLGGVTNTIANGNVNVPILYNYGTSIQSGYYVNAAPNTALDWEYTRTTNIGLDFGLFGNRLTGSVDYYNAQTYNILYGLALPSSSGIPGNFVTNIGKMENKGLEITLSSVNVRTQSGFTWSTDLNLFFNRNKLLSLNDGFVRNIPNGLHVGQPLSAIYDYDKLGIWQINEAAQAATFGQVPGQIKVRDISGPDGKPDGKIDADNDRTIIGSGQAKLQGGLTNRFTYKGFDFSFVAYARIGGTLVSGVHQPYAGYLAILDGRRNQLAVDYWTPTNPTNAFPMPSSQITPPNASNAWSTLGYYDASFVKIRSINLGYTVNTNVLSRLGARSVRVYVQAQNPFLLFSPYVKAGGVDPEPTGTGTNGFVQSGGNIPNRALTISLNTPPTRSFIVGVNLGF
ncbi:TonB-dependent receptor [Spirosoma sp. KCTC 42546]|uniref:TonB-dependent receptor n=1 Tax=Spirosoma sp. KCTC 42546 TaxID=2520506 RepID=UPI00143DD26D|nr:TonB-dependent receptor [Spirosoma sp. KCTC 42546]